MSLFLSRDELFELTGRKLRSKVTAWLTENGYKYEVAADGWPKVLRAAVEARLMPSAAKRKAKIQPNFTAYESSKKAA